MPDVLAVISWWIIIQLLGLLAWPLAFRLFHWLPDRGYMFAKPLGLLLVSYTVWLLASLQILPHTTGGVIGAAVLVLGISCWKYRQLHGRQSPPADSYSELLTWLRNHGRLVVAYEVLFAASFVGWSIFRAQLPDIVTSEKPMEMAFYNAVFRATWFPPQDPWLSGNTIPYYYFGYVMMSVLNKTVNLPSGAVQSLASALWFGLAAAGAFGLAADLILLSARKVSSSVLIFSLMATSLLLLMSNLEPPLEIARAAGWGSSEFWSWLDLRGTNPPFSSADPDRPGWPLHTAPVWWLYSSRVIHDYAPTALSPTQARALGKTSGATPVTQDFIDEFPLFTFLLADNHAHLLDIPFVLLAIGLAFNLYQAGTQRAARSPIWGNAGVYVWLVYPLVLGALSFTNAWDYPIYLVLMVAAFALGQWQSHRLRILGVLADFLTLGMLSILLYLPYFTGLAPQGLLVWPNIFNGTRLPQFFTVLGAFLVIGTLFIAKLLIEQVQAGHCRYWSFGWRSLVGGLGLIALTILIVSSLGAAVYHYSTDARQWFDGLIGQMRANDVTIGDFLLLRLRDPWVLIISAGGLMAIWWLWRVRQPPSINARSDPLNPRAFVLLLFALGLLLVLGVEAVHLIGPFDKTRVNTGFKFYFQIWILWSVASAYAAYYLLQGQSRVAAKRRRGLVGGVIAGFICPGLVYAILTIPSRINSTVEPRLDAMLSRVLLPLNRETDYPGYQAAEWINANLSGTPVILEASDGTARYEIERSRISSWTGLPTVLGWYWHESLWRGSSDAARQRLMNIESIYSTADVAAALKLLQLYNVSYIYVGPYERKLYPAAGLSKFDRVFPVVFQENGVKIYRVP